MARPFPIGDQSEGINHARFKGGASPKALYDLLNAWVTPQKIIKGRGGAGSPFARAPAGTVGGIDFEGKVHVFAGVPTPNNDPLVEVHVLRHPDGTDAALLDVHAAFPFLGRIYCVAEWADEVVRHFWLQGQADWAPETAYTFGAVVSPTEDTGFVYEITNEVTANPWSASASIALNDEVLPTVANGFKYKATAVVGSPARTGDTEPVWPTTEGGTVTEYDNA